MPFVSETKNKDSLLELRHMDACSVEFYAELEQKIKYLNYIVLATENDELNITLGVRILKMAIRYRKDLKHLCILVRIHNDDDGHYERTAQFYNKLWGAQEATGSTKATANDSFLKTESRDFPLYIFGQDKKVYSYENIIDDNIVKKAKLFKEQYKSSLTHGYTPQYEEGETSWDRELEELLQINGIYQCTYAGMMKLRRTQRQDISNSQHIQTKKILAQKALSKSGRQQVDWGSIDRKPKTTSYYSTTEKEINPEVARLLNVLAQTEHLRWIASHEILGYLVDKNGLAEKDECRLTHGCLTDWENLDNSRRIFDYVVVDVTLGIKYPSKTDDRQRDHTGLD